MAVMKRHLNGGIGDSAVCRLRRGVCSNDQGGRSKMRGLDQRVDMASGSRSRRRQQLAEEGATVAVGDGI